jgi:SAM-dependent methyltransferase
MEAIMPEWFEREGFWDDFSGVLFGPDRWAATPAAVDRLLSLLDPAPQARILDLCCGPGRHSLELARRGYRITGVDRTERYLAEARTRAAEEKLDIEWVQEDMRRFSRPGFFDAAINLFTSFGYFEDPEDDVRVARNLFDSLRPGGKLLIDTQGKEPLAREFRERDWHWIDEEHGTILLEERTLAPDWGRITSVWTLITGTERRTAEFSLRLYSGTEMTALFQRAGFSETTLFGASDGRLYDHNAARLILLAVK